MKTQSKTFPDPVSHSSPDMLSTERKRAPTQTERNPRPPDKRLYTLKEASEYLGRSVWGVRELIWAGKIPIVREEGGRKIFLDLADLENFVLKNKSVYR